MKTTFAMGLALILAGVGSVSANSLLQGAAMDMAKDQATHKAMDYATNKAMEIVIPDATGGPEALGSWTILSGGPANCAITFLPRENDSNLKPIEIADECSRGSFNVKFWERRGNFLYLNDLAGMTKAKLMWDKGEDQWQGSIGRFDVLATDYGVFQPGSEVILLTR